jgi:hypothetical protein
LFVRVHPIEQTLIHESELILTLKSSTALAANASLSLRTVYSFTRKLEVKAEKGSMFLNILPI